MTTKPTISKESELRLKVIHAVCFKPHITGHIEQFEQIEALIVDQQRQLLDRLLDESKHFAKLSEMGRVQPKWTEAVPVSVINDIREGLS